jgi:hypothetical protein
VNADLLGGIDSYRDTGAVAVHPGRELASNGRWDDRVDEVVVKRWSCAAAPIATPRGIRFRTLPLEIYSLCFC